MKPILLQSHRGPAPINEAPFDRKMVETLSGSPFGRRMSGSKVTDSASTIGKGMLKNVSPRNDSTCRVVEKKKKRNRKAHILRSVRIDRVSEDGEGRLKVDESLYDDEDDGDEDVDNVNHFSVLSQLEDLEQKPTITGVITFHIKEIVKMYLSDSWSGEHLGLYVQVSCRGLSKRTSMVVDGNGKASWNQSLHLPVFVVRERLHPFNWIQLDLVSSDMARVGFAEVILGSVSFHIHDVIRALSTDSEFDVFKNGSYSGTLKMGVMFNYGLYGYGYSAQLPVGRPIDDQLEHSLFPRVDPPEDRMEPKRATLIPRAVPHPSFIPFREKVHFREEEEVERKEDEKEEGGSPMENSISKLMNRSTDKLKHLRGILDGIGSRSTRLAFLNAHIHKSTYPKEAIVFDTNKFKSKGGYTSNSIEEQAATHSRPDYYSCMKPAAIVERMHFGHSTEKEAAILYHDDVPEKKEKAVNKWKKTSTGLGVTSRRPKNMGTMRNPRIVPLPGGIAEEDGEEEEYRPVRRVKSDIPNGSSSMNFGESKLGKAARALLETSLVSSPSSPRRNDSLGSNYKRSSYNREDSLRSVDTKRIMRTTTTHEHRIHIVPPGYNSGDDCSSDGD